MPPGLGIAFLIAILFFALAIPLGVLWMWWDDHRHRVPADQPWGRHEPWCDHKTHPQVGLAAGVRWRCYRCLAWMEPEPDFWIKFRRANGLQRH